MNLGVAGNAGGSVCSWIEINGMATTLAQKLAALSQQMADQVAPFHFIERLDVNFNEFTSRVRRALLVGKFPVGGNDQFESILQIAASFGQRPALSIHTR